MQQEHEANDHYMLDYIRRALNIDLIMFELNAIKSTDEVEKLSMEITKKLLKKQRNLLWYNGITKINNIGLSD